MWRASCWTEKLPEILWWSGSAPSGIAFLLQSRFSPGRSSWARQKKKARPHTEKPSQSHPDQTYPSKPAKETQRITPRQIFTLGSSSSISMCSEKSLEFLIQSLLCSLSQGSNISILAAGGCSSCQSHFPPWKWARPRKQVTIHAESTWKTRHLLHKPWTKPPAEDKTEQKCFSF